jgi:hypothetical protein
MEWRDRVREIALAGLRRRHPAASEREIQVRFIRQAHGIELAAVRKDRA